MNEQSLKEDLDKLLFGIRRSIRYHSRRCRFFDNVNIWCKFLSALGGTATIAAVLSKFGPEWIISFAVIVTFFSILDLVIGSAQKARLHDDFKRQFIELERDTILKEEISRQDMLSLTARRLEIEAQEPPPLRVLDVICHNELCRAMNRESGQVKVKWYQRLFCQIIDIGDHKITSENCR